MCIVVYKPDGAAFPKKSVLKTCFEHNSDGAGFMLANGKSVVIDKGYMTFKEFYNALTKARKKWGDEIPYVLHFRITTQAGVRKDCCHPFPLSDKMDELRKLSTTANIGIAHNGIISLTSSYYVREVTYNDTMLFITDYLSLIIDDEHYYKNERTLTLIERLCESKLAILDRYGHCELIGNGWIWRDGVAYSNSTFEEYKSVKPVTYIGKGSYYYDDGYPAETEYRDDWWEAFYDYKTGEYDFEPDYCPLYCDSDDYYCKKCKNRKDCKAARDFAGLDFKE